MKMIISLICLLSIPALSQMALIEKKLTLQIQNPVADEAKKEAVDKALSQVTEELGKDFLGEERFTKNRSLIIGKILKDSAKYIPFSKSTLLGSQNDLHTIQIDMKISQANFRQLLQDQSLLSQGEAQPVLIPYISWVDKSKSKSYRWWKDRSDTSAEIIVRHERLLEQAFKAAFLKNGFYAWRPLEIALWNQLPSLYQSERLTKDDYQTLGLYFESPLAIEGSVIISTSSERSDRFQIEMKWTAFLTENGKTVGDISRQFLTEAGPQDRVVEKKLKEVLDLAASDLSNQIFEAWQKGTLSSKTMRLTIRSGLNLKSQEKFRDQVRSQFSMIKSIRERLVVKDQITFEIDSAMSAKDLALKFDHFVFDTKKYKAEVQGEDEIILKAESL